jgi:hypothetical protein
VNSIALTPNANAADKQIRTAEINDSQMKISRIEELMRRKMNLSRSSSNTQNTFGAAGERSMRFDRS